MREPRPRIETPPGPPPRRGLVDSALYFYRFATDAIGVVGERFARYGDLYYAPSDECGLFVLRHPDHIRQVLVTDAASYAKEHSAFARIEQVLGTGLLTSDGETWKRHRRMIQPSFHPKRLTEYAAAMEDEARAWGERWRGETERDIGRDIGRDMMELTLRIVGRTLFGHDVSAHTDAVRRSMKTLTEQMVRPDLLPGWMPSPQRRRLERAVGELDRIIYDMIDRRRSGEDPPRGDLLGALASAVDAEGDGRRLSEREVRDELVTMFLAGHETTSHALTWTWYLLAQNPKAEAALHEEVDRVAGDRRLGYDDLEALPYTQQVLSEAMRLYPPAFMVARRAQRDTEIGGFPVTAGSEVVVWTYFTHRDPRWYPEPEAFRPERFAPDARAALPQQAYLPFGAGSRTCIGKSFAMIEATLILATLARRYRLRLATGQRVVPKPRVTLAPAGALRMRLQPR